MIPSKTLVASCLVLFSTTLLATTNKDELTHQGIKIYERACKTCHAPSVAKGLGAPAAFDQSQWHPRLENAKNAVKENPKQYKKASDYLLYQVKTGKGLMHHGGLCKELENIDCSDKAILDAITYMSKE